MARPTPQSAPKSASRKAKSNPAPSPAKGSNPFLIPSDAEAATPMWLARSIAMIIGLSLFCGYLTLCFLFYQGQWQLVLHPGHASKPLALGETVRFALDESATPQLTGHFLVAEPQASYAAYTLLCLPGGDGSLADFAPRLQALQAAGLNLFAFDYRGYGQSAALHPGQQSMSQDVASAWQYLTTSRHIAPGHILLYGTGVGASLAAQFAAQHPEIPALLLEDPRGDLLDAIRSDPRTHGVPIGLLFRERFPLARPLSTLAMPKLLLSANLGGQTPEAFRTAADPKTTVELAPNDSNAQTLLQQSLTRFLDQHLTRQAPPLQP